MKSKEFTWAKRYVSATPAQAKWCKQRRSREGRRAVRSLLRNGAEHVAPVVNARHITGAAARDIS